MPDMAGTSDGVRETELNGNAAIPIGDTSPLGTGTGAVPACIETRAVCACTGTEPKAIVSARRMDSVRFI